MITQDTCAFYQDHAVYKQFRGVVLDKEEGVHIAAALGNKKVRCYVLLVLPAMIDLEMSMVES